MFDNIRLTCSRGFKRVQEMFEGGSRDVQERFEKVPEGLRDVREMFGRVRAIRNVPGTVFYTYCEIDQRYKTEMVQA